jgi:hypothetical protein
LYRAVVSGHQAECVRLFYRRQTMRAARAAGEAAAGVNATEM